MTAVAAVESRPEAPAGPHWPVLDGVRAIAVLGVVAYHLYRLAAFGEARSEAAPVLWQWPLATGRYGVDAFFVLSGLLVMRSWAKCRDGGGGFLAALRMFWQRRAKRILPAYWVSLAVLVVVAAPELLTDVRRLLLLFSVNQYMDPGLVGRVNTPLWSLTTEWHFYAAVPVLFWTARRVSTPVVLLVALVVSVLWRQQQLWDIPASALPGRLDQFMAGALAGELVAAWRAGHSSIVVRLAQRRFVGVALVAVVVALGTYEGATLGVARGRLLDPFVHPIVGVCVALLLVRLLTVGGPWPLVRGPVVGVGLMSYSLFLWHYPIIKYGTETLDGLAPAPVLRALGLVVIVLVVFGVSLLSYRLVEYNLLHGDQPPLRQRSDHQRGRRRLLGRGAVPASASAAGGGAARVVGHRVDGGQPVRGVAGAGRGRPHHQH